MWTCPLSHSQKFRWSVWLAVWGLVLIFGTADGIAQSPELSGPAFPNQVEPAAAIPPVQPAAPVEYWIASSRKCCQRSQTRCPRGTLQYFAADARNALTPLAEPAFLSSLRYDVPVCFVVHGDLTSFCDVRRAAPSIVKWIRGGAQGQPVQIVFYTWPSDDENAPLPQLDISARGERAEFNGCYLAKLIAQFPANSRVSFFGHSFGTRVVASTLHLLAGGTIPGCQFRCPPAAVRTYRAVLAAAAMDRDWLNPGNRYGGALQVTQWLLNIRNGADLVINLYPLRSLFGPQALGRVGFSPRDRLRMGFLSSRVTEWDVTRGLGTKHAWVHYYTRPEIAAVMAPLLVYADASAPKISPPIIGDRRRSTPITRNVRPPVQPPVMLRDSTRLRTFSLTRSGL